MSGDNIMGGVIISPNIKKEKAQIDVDGNEVRPFTKEVIKPKDQFYVPTQAEREAAQKATEATEAAKDEEPETGEEIKPQAEPIVDQTDFSNLSIKDMKALIETKEDELDDLKKAFKEKVRKVRAELEELEGI